jgi:predicted NBD/HSP70 family sugar kinase
VVSVKPLLRQFSLGSVMDAIITHGPISRAQIAKLSNISKQTASEVVRELEAAGWLRVHGQTRGSIGRSALTYEIRPDAAYIVGVDLGGSQLRMAIANLACVVVAEDSEETRPEGGISVVDQIVALVRRLARRSGIAAEAIRIVVLGTPGVLNDQRGSIDLAPNIPDFDRMDVVGSLRERLKTDVVVENDVNVGAIGERWLGQAKGIDTFAYVALGTGLGMGMVSGGQLIRGAHGAAGEIANLPIGGDPFDPANRDHGTLEAMVGAHGIARRYENAGGRPGLTVREIFDRLEIDPVARSVIEETARLLALAVVSIVATFDPERVVVGGSIGSRPEIVDGIRSTLPSLISTPVVVEASALGNRSGIAGALAIGINNVHNTLFAPSFSPRALSLPAIDEIPNLGFA